MRKIYLHKKFGSFINLVVDCNCMLRVVIHIIRELENKDNDKILHHLSQL